MNSNRIKDINNLILQINMKTNNIFSRRDFLKTSGIVAGSTLMGSAIHSQTFSKIENPNNQKKN